MVKKTTPRAPQIMPKLGGKDVIGQKPLIKGVNNNIVYAGGLLLVLGAGFLISNPMLLGRLTGAPPPGPPASVQVTPPSVQPGQAVTIQGAFNPPVPQAFYIVTNSQGQQVASGSLGNNVSQFSQQIPATNLPSGSYTVTVSDSPSPGGPGPTGTVGPQGPGQTFPTSAALQQGLTGGGGLGPATSGPENISLT